MAKKDSFINMVATLFIITAVPAILLGFVYKFTKEPISQVKEIKLKNSINLVVPGADKAEIKQFCVMPDNGKDSLHFYEVLEDGKIIGTAVQTYSDNGFGGRISVMVGFDTNGVIIDNDVIEHHETPGLGDKTAKSKSDWNSRFNNIDPKNSKLFIGKGGIDAITAATISSRAYCDAIQRAYDAFSKYYKIDENQNEKGGTE